MCNRLKEYFDKLCAFTVGQWNQYSHVSLQIFLQPLGQNAWNWAHFCSIISQLQTIFQIRKCSGIIWRKPTLEAFFKNMSYYVWLLELATGIKEWQILICHAISYGLLCDGGVSTWLHINNWKSVILDRGWIITEFLPLRLACVVDFLQHALKALFTPYLAKI